MSAKNGPSDTNFGHFHSTRPSIHSTMGRTEHSKKANGSSGTASSIYAGGAELDPCLTSLFASTVSKSPYLHQQYETNNNQTPSHIPAVSRLTAGSPLAESESVNGVAQQQDDDEPGTAAAEVSDGEKTLNDQVSAPAVSTRPTSELRSRKRKRRDENADLEASYMRKLAKEEAKERKQSSNKRQKALIDEQAANDATPQPSSDEHEDAEGDEAIEVPQHETLTQGKAPELEKSNRTVFLGNVSTEAIASKTAKKELLNHLSSFLSSLPAEGPTHKIESIRFRSTAYDIKIPKKAAFVRKELMDSTTKSTNAYVVYTSQLAAREAVKRLNGTIILDRHLRVDSVVHPSQIDHRRCVFVGNLDFVDDDTQIREANEEEGRGEKKNKKPADVEEGLWRQFGTAGTVESVRVVRDSKTRVGKGFAYVQFTDENAVEASLLFNDKKFPPMLPRKLRVVRAKSTKRNTSNRPSAHKTLDPDAKSMQGRASKLLGRAGAANLKKVNRKLSGSTSIKPPEAFVVEGHRASSRQGTAGLKLGGSGKRMEKSRSRSNKRAAAWKAAGGKKKATK